MAQRVTFRKKISISWKLFKISWKVASHDRELILLELFAFVISLVGAGVIWGITFGIFWSSGTPLVPDSLFYGLPSLLTFWLFGAVFSYFRGAQIAGANERLTGGDPTVSSALKAVAPMRMEIIKWGILTSSVSFLLAVVRAIARDKGSGGGRIAVEIVTRIIGAAWNFITFLALPIVVFESLPPFKAVKRSAQLLKKTWGVQLIGGLVIEFFIFLFVLSAVIPGAIGFAIGGWLLGGILAGIYIYIGLLYWSLVTAVYQTALYMYVTTGKEIGPFEGIGFDKFFIERKNKTKTS